MMYYKALIGSRGYGYHTEASDLDYYGFYIESKEQLFGLEDSKVEVEKTERTSTTLHPLKKFVALCDKGAFQAIETLFADSVIDTTNGVIAPLLTIRDAFIDKQYLLQLNGAVKSMMGGKTTGSAIVVILRHYYYLKKYLETGIYSIKLDGAELEEVRRLKRETPIVNEKDIAYLSWRLSQIHSGDLPEQIDSKQLEHCLYSIYESVYFPPPIVSARTVDDIKKELRAAKKIERAEKVIWRHEDLNKVQNAELALVARLLKKNPDMAPEIVWAALNLCKREKTISIERALKQAAIEWRVELDD